MTAEEEAKILLIGLKVSRIGIDLATGDRKDAGVAAKELLGMAVDMIPVDEMKDFLTERDRIFADLATDVAEQIKLEGA